MHPFAEKFAATWSRPTPEQLVALLHEDVVLRQPHLRAIRGKAAALAEFRKLLTALPDFHGEGFNAVGDEQQVFIEWRMTPTRNHPGHIPAVDRISLRDGLVLERVVYFDQFALLRQVLTRPAIWGGFLKYRFGPSVSPR